MPSDTSAPQECHDKNEKDQDNHHRSEERTRGLFDKNENDQYNERDQLCVKHYNAAGQGLKLHD